MPWYQDVLLAAATNTELDQEHPIIVGIIPMIVEKVIVPFLVGSSECSVQTWEDFRQIEHI